MVVKPNMEKSAGISRCGFRARIKITAKINESPNQAKAQGKGSFKMECTKFKFNDKLLSHYPSFRGCTYLALFNDKTLSGWKLQNRFPCLGKEFLSSFLLLFEVLPSVIIKNDHSASHNKRI